MRVATRERGSGASVTGRSPDRPVLRRSSLVAIDTKGRQPQRPVLVLALLPTVTLKRLNLDASGTLAPQASGVRPGLAWDPLKTSGNRNLDNSRCGSSPVTRRTSRIVQKQVAKLIGLSVFQLGKLMGYRKHCGHLTGTWEITLEVVQAT